MSLLLDAVTRHRHGEALKEGLEPAMLAALPQPRSSRRFRGIWLAPFVGGVLGAGLAAALGNLPQPSLPSAPDTPSSSIELAQRVAMPLPVSLPSDIAEESGSADEVPLAGLPVAVIPPPSAHVAKARPQTAAPDRLEEAVVSPPDLVQAFEAVLADLGGEVLPESLDRPAAAEVAVTGTEPPPLDPELQRRLAQVQRELAEAKGQPQPPAPMPDNSSVPKLGQMPWSFQKRLPDLTVTAHVYATKREDRWLRANGRELQEGDEAANGLTVVEILPSEIVLEMDQQRFRIPALGSL
ncbi:general secretion pathway protein GspB [Ferrimonas gelatinilytica]|uniref:Type II secretion system protein GspB C-terminal domain-containing protein n=1 Tax=Ferrimonas gelatinilytica TaxID=1255257 RepID=A0ABP9S8G9_9GAMM